MSTRSETAATPLVRDLVKTSLFLPRGRSLWSNGLARLQKSRLTMACFLLIGLYSLFAALASFGWIASPWDRPVGDIYQPPSFESIELWLGTDLFGRSVLYKVIHGARVAMGVGLITSLISVPIGVGLGAVAGYFGGVLDEIIAWVYTTLSSVPSIMLMIAMSFVLGKGLWAVCIAIGTTSWVGLARIIRGEVIKHKERDYIVAAQAIGASHPSRIFRHILPNVFPFVIIHFSLHFVLAIKTEVILSYLGLGVQGQPSWGVMIDDAKLELARGVWWQLGGATVAMFGIVLALNIVGDALRDAFDPKVQ